VLDRMFAVLFMLGFMGALPANSAFAQVQQPAATGSAGCEPSFETAQGVQFGYRCQYSSRER
jgi:hypothetical protein